MTRQEAPELVVAMSAHTIKVGNPIDGKRRIAWGSDHLDRYAVQHLRWLYRSMRRDGMRRSSARMYLTCSFLLGGGAGHTKGMQDARPKGVAA